MCYLRERTMSGAARLGVADDDTWLMIGRPQDGQDGLCRRAALDRTTRERRLAADAHARGRRLSWRSREAAEGDPTGRRRAGP